MRAAVILLWLSLASTALAADQCRPIVILSGMEGGGDYPGAVAGWYKLRAEALGIPAPSPPDECAGLIRGEVSEVPLSHETVQLCRDLLSATPANWIELPGVALPVDPEWVDTRGKLARLNPLGSPEWAPYCDWTKAAEWVRATICTHGNLHYAPCGRFPGACAVRFLTSTWAKHQRCKDGYCWYDCTGYAEVRALGAETFGAAPKPYAAEPGR